MSGTRPILVLGGSGMLGGALLGELDRRGFPAVAPPRATFDLCAGDPRRLLAELRPRATINAAAYSDVAGAERPEERAEVLAVNRDGPARLAEACRERGIPFVHLSTDFVFDGTAARPYREDDPTGPLQVYGESKLAGERAVRAAAPRALIVRTSTMYGAGRRARPHYVDAILAQARSGASLRVVRTPVSSPTYAPDLAAALLALLDAAAEGVVHVVNAGGCSRLELAREAIERAGLGDRTTVVERPEDPGGLRRPAYSVLDTARCAALTRRPMRDWREALADYVGSLGR